MCRLSCHGAIASTLTPGADDKGTSRADVFGCARTYDFCLKRDGTASSPPSPRAAVADLKAKRIEVAPRQRSNSLLPGCHARAGIGANRPFRITGRTRLVATADSANRVLQTRLHSTLLGLRAACLNVHTALLATRIGNSSAGATAQAECKGCEADEASGPENGTTICCRTGSGLLLALPAAQHACKPCDKWVRELCWSGGNEGHRHVRGTTDARKPPKARISIPAAPRFRFSDGCCRLVAGRLLEGGRKKWGGSSGTRSSQRFSSTTMRYRGCEFCARPSQSKFATCRLKRKGAVFEAGWRCRRATIRLGIMYALHGNRAEQPAAWVRGWASPAVTELTMCGIERVLHAVLLV